MGAFFCGDLTAVCGGKDVFILDVCGKEVYKQSRGRGREE